MYHLDGITFFGNTDFNSKEAQEKIQTTLGDRKVNCILSDMVSIKNYIFHESKLE